MRSVRRRKVSVCALVTSLLLLVLGVVPGTVERAEAQGTLSPTNPVTTTTTAIPVGDYGDAPDQLNALYPAPFASVLGKFPTEHATTNSRYGLPGGHTLTAGQERFGPTVSVEKGPKDSADPDSTQNFIDDDFDNGLGGSACPIDPAGPFTPATQVTLTFKVTVDASAPAGTRYINLLVDQNHDGVWSNGGAVPEWVVQDFAINVAPGQTQNVTVGPFPLAPSSAASWMRASLTRQTVASVVPVNATGWDGSGSFSHGEIEDYLLGHSVSHVQAASLAVASADAYAAAVAAAWANAQAWASAIATSCSSASAWAAAIDIDVAAAAAAAASASVSFSAASASAFDADASCSGASALAVSTAAACASCDCASACAAAGAAAFAQAQACAVAISGSSASAAAASAAFASAQAASVAVAAAGAQAASWASACATGVANANAAASALATAHAQAEAHADAAALALANAQAAACGGNTSAAASAAAAAAASAQASAQVAVSAQAQAYAAAQAYASASSAAAALALAFADADAFAAAAAQAQTAAASAASASAFAAAAAASTASSMASGFAAAGAGCSGDCAKEICCDQAEDPVEEPADPVDPKPGDPVGAGKSSKLLRSIFAPAAAVADCTTKCKAAPAGTQ